MDGYALLCLWVFPARAGMSLTASRIDDLIECVPRASGDEPNTIDKVITEYKCSPRERG